MGYWKIVVPEEGFNKVLSPSAETGNIPTEYATYNGAVSVTRYALDSFLGFQCYSVNTNGANQGINLDLDTLANAIHYVTFALKNPPGSPGVQVSLDAANWHIPDVIYTGFDGDWHIYGTQIPAAQANASVDLYIRTTVGGNIYWYVDRVQVEESEYWTTYMDGDQPGCEWEGFAHASVTRRSALSRAGGRVRDLADVYHFDIESMDGAGLPPTEFRSFEYALSPGGDVSQVRDTMRPLTLTGVLEDPASWNSLEDLRSARRDLIEVLKGDSLPLNLGRPQPVRLWYTEGSDYPPRYIDLHYEEGLRLAVHGTFPCSEVLALRFLAEDPYFYEIKDFARSLQTRDTLANTRLVYGRIKDNEIWSNLGPPNAAGTYTSINAIIFGPDGKLYVGGNFTTFDNIAGADYLCRYDFEAATWELVGPGGSVNGIVDALALGPDGIIYIGGQFTNLGGGTGDSFSSYNPVTNTFSNVGDITGAAVATMTTVNDIAFDTNGDIWIVGNFLNVGASPAADYIARYDYSAGGWGTPLGAAPATATMYSVIVDADRYVWVGGSAANIGGLGANGNYIAKIYQGVVYQAVPSGANNVVNALELADDQSVYVGGNFTTLGGNTSCNYIGRVFAGQAFDLDLGMGARVWNIHKAPDGTMYVSGIFSTAGSLTVDRIAAWNGFAWVQVPVYSGAGTVYEIVAGNPDPTTERRYDLFVGGTQTGTVYTGGRTAFSYPGDQAAKPQFRYYDPSAVADLYVFRNETLGTDLFMNYGVRDGEDFRIDLRPGKVLVYSTFGGRQPGAILPGSDIEEFRVIPGTNIISMFTPEATGAGFISMPIRYGSVD